MIKPDQIAEAYKTLSHADEARTKSEIEHGNAKRAYEAANSEVTYRFKEFLKTDPVNAQMEIRKATVVEFAAWVEAEKAMWQKQLEYRQSGYIVDSLNRQVEAEKLALQK